MSIILQCDRTGCPELVETNDAKMTHSALGNTIDVFVGDASEVEGWVLEYAGNDRVLHCPEHAEAGPAA